MLCALWAACTLPPFPILPVVRRIVRSVFHSADWVPADPLHGTFAESQIKAARENLEFSLRMTVDLFGSLQGTLGFSYHWISHAWFFPAQVIIALWYWYNARWSEVSFASRGLNI